MLLWTNAFFDSGREIVAAVRGGFRRGLQHRNMEIRADMKTRMTIFQQWRARVVWCPGSIQFECPRHLENGSMSKKLSPRQFGFSYLMLMSEAKSIIFEGFHGKKLLLTSKKYSPSQFGCPHLLNARRDRPTTAPSARYCFLERHIKPYAIPPHSVLLVWLLKEHKY